MRSHLKGIAWLCLLLMVSSAWADVAHHHSSKANASACQVCVAAHSTVPTHASPTPKPELRRTIAVNCRAVGAKQRLISFARYVRPPPTV